MLETVKANFEGYTKKQVERSVLARRLQSMLAHPPDEKFKELVSNPGYDSKVTAESITNAKSIFGPNRARLLGATVKKSQIGWKFYSRGYLGSSTCFTSQFL